ncbi:MAG: hypothetical protein ACTSWR_10430 [Candidatus Helarchaeota archaeon]
MEKKKKTAVYTFLKMLRIGNYQDICSFITKYLDGEYNDYKFLNDEIIAKTLNISKVKASSILRKLKKFHLIKGSPNKNLYYLIDQNEFENIFINSIETHMKSAVNTIKSIIGKNIYPNFYIKLNPLDGLAFFNNKLKFLNLNTNVYQESPVSALTTPIEWSKLPNFEKKAYNSIMFKINYKNRYKRFQIIKSRLEKIHNSNSEGKFFYVLFLKRDYQRMIDTLISKGYTKQTLSHILIAYLERFKNIIIEFKDYFLENELMVLLDFDSTCFNGPISILPPYVFRMYYSSTSESDLMELHITSGNSYCDNMVRIFNKFFNNLLIKYSIYDNLSEIIVKKDLGEKLYNHCLKTISNKISEIEEQ